MSSCSYNIKTITCHDVYNTGASLQAFALSYYLKKLGHNIEIIDYKPEYLLHYQLWGVKNPKYDKPIIRILYNILKLPQRIVERFSKRKRVFDQFTKEYLSLTKKKYTTNEELKAENISADIIFAGSDQIWNTVFQNGKDPAFYLDFASSKTICASYAASFATEDIVDEYKAIVGTWLKKLNFVSVRESSGIDILKKLGIENGCIVCDPVFLLSKDEWRSFAVNNNCAEKYLLIYDFDNNDELNQKAVYIAKENGWKIYSIFPNSICDRCCFNCGPLEFVGLIKDAEMIISNSFHATAFSIIFEKHFLVFDRQEKINTRMRDLLVSLNIFDEKVIDYDKVNFLLNDYIENSKKYIDKVIAAVGDREDDSEDFSDYTSL